MLGKGKLMLRSIISILAILLSTAVNAGEAGRIVFSAGTSTVGGEGAVAGHPVQEGDEVATGKDGYVYIKTV
ncbi:MAG: hypothetical protein K0S28_78, partial [Paucimonas sp.]|nr:hypothetical protein [Paucimonas sp.]